MTEGRITRPALDWPALASQEPPTRRWAIKGWVGFGHVTLMVGSGGIGKTLLAQQIASCLALGKPFIGDVPGPFNCLMWACEDDHDELWRRQIDLARWCDAPLADFGQGLVIIPRHGLDNTIVSTEYGRLTFSTLLGELSEQAADLDAEVVILDNVGQLYGGSENDRHAVTAFLNALSGALPGRAILLLAHPSRSSGSEFSGSSAWENVARTRLYLGATLPGERPDPEAKAEDTVRYLSRRKANYSPKDWRRMTYANGALTPDEIDPQGGMVGAIRAAKAEGVIVAAINKLTTLGIPVTDGQRSSQFLPRVMAEYKLDEGLNKRELLIAMREMILAGRLERAVVGKKANRGDLKGLVLVEQPA